MISTILIDDEPLARSIVREYLEEFPQIEVMQDCNDGFDGLKAIMHHRPQFTKAVEKFITNNELPPAEKLLESAAASPQQRHRVVVKTGGKIKIIPVEEIQFLEAADDYVKIQTKEGTFLKKRTMSHFEAILDGQQFVRTHRSYIVNVQHITRIDPYEKENYLAVLKDGKQIPDSKSGYARLKQVLGL